jgi:integrase
VSPNSVGCPLEQRVFEPLTQALALTWADVNAHERNLTVRIHSAKTGDTRHVPLNDEALETLQRWRKQNMRQDRVFPITTSFKTARATLLKRQRHGFAGMICATILHVA